MADISQRILIKYGLAERPTQQNTLDWVRQTEQLIREGLSQEVAGEQAARALFKDYRTRKYASQADTIETLLTEAARK